jgi:hypothetical protein
MNIVPPPERAHGDSSNVKSCCTLKEIAHVVKVTTQKANQIKYHEANISCLYLINQFHLI